MKSRSLSPASSAHVSCFVCCYAAKEDYHLIKPHELRVPEDVSEPSLFYLVEVIALESWERAEWVKPTSWITRGRRKGNQKALVSWNGLSIMLSVRRVPQP